MNYTTLVAGILTWTIKAGMFLIRILMLACYWYKLKNLGFQNWNDVDMNFVHNLNFSAQPKYTDTSVVSTSKFEV